MTRFADCFGADPTRLSRDDRVLPATRWTGRVVAPILVLAFLILFLFPDRTTELFAWTIRPDMTPLVMGAGYGTGAYFFYRVATIDGWHRVAAVFPGIAVFTWFMAVATVLHWENFNHGHATFAAWVLLYVLSPLVIPAVWLLNQRVTARKLDRTVVQLPQQIRRLSLVSGLLVTVASVLLFVTPDMLLLYWPWDVSSLTARILLGWFALFGVVNVVVGLDPRWDAARIPVQTQLLGFGLLLLGVVRAWSDFDTTNPFTWAFLGAFVLYTGALAVLYFVMERRPTAA